MQSSRIQRVQLDRYILYQINGTTHFGIWFTGLEREPGLFVSKYGSPYIGIRHGFLDLA